MARRSEVDRTVQYWRLVDARNGSLVEEIDWESVLQRLQGSRNTFTIDQREHAGTVTALEVTPEWKDGLDVSGLEGVIAPQNPDLTRGLVVAAGKDYVPNQENVGSGAQKPMGLEGDDWTPVDNLFVWHLPFGNMIGVLAESTSSSRAATYADWLTKATRFLFEKEDPEFAWMARPVIDQTRANLLKKADGLRGFVYAGEIGESVNDATGVRSIFLGPRREPGAIRIEIKASLVRGKSDPHDDRVILDWFSKTFGSLDGAVDKAQVTVSAAGDRPVSEVDLLHHRLTRKTRVTLATGTTRAFTSMSALGAIVSAFQLDRADLQRLRFSTD